MSNDIALIAECDDSYKRTENWKKTIQCYTCGRIEHIAREYQNKGNGKYKLNAQGGPEKEHPLGFSCGAFLQTCSRA